MISIKFLDGQHCPVFLCDFCGKLINEGGHVTYDPVAGRGAGGAEPRFYHKFCDPRTDPYWEELAKFLADLQHNAGIEADEEGERWA